MTAVIYARFSTGADQTDASIDGQLRECREYAEKHNITIATTYADHAISGRTDKRPEFLRMISDAEAKKFDVIIVWKLDRFARNRYDSAIYKAKLRKLGIKVVSAKEAISDSPEGVILESVLEGMAEYYSANLAQNVKRGMTEAALKGKIVGGTVPLGYKRSSDNTFEIDGNTAPIVREIFKMYADGETITEIVGYLNGKGLRSHTGKAFTHNALHRILNNEKYIGIYKWAGIVSETGIPPIVDQNLFYKVQAVLKKNKRAPARAKAKVMYMLTGKVFCGICGGSMIGETGTGKSKKTYNYYKCSTSKKQKTCKKKPIRKEELEEVVIRETINIALSDSVIDHIADKVVLLQEEEQDRSVLKSLEHRLTEVNKSISNFVKAIEMGIINEATQARMKELDIEKANLEIGIAQESAELPKLTKDQIVFWLSQFKNGDVEDREYCQKLIDVFVQAVHVYEDYIVITYNYTDPDDTDPSGKQRKIHRVERSDFNADGAPQVKRLRIGVFLLVRIIPRSRTPKGWRDSKVLGEHLAERLPLGAPQVKRLRIGVFLLVRIIPRSRTPEGLA